MPRTTICRALSSRLATCTSSRAVLVVNGERFIESVGELLPADAVFLDRIARRIQPARNSKPGAATEPLAQVLQHALQRNVYLFGPVLEVLGHFAKRPFQQEEVQQRPRGLPLPGYKPACLGQAQVRP